MPASNQKGGLHLNSARARMLEFFKRNPDEELTYADAVLKFDINPRNIRSVIERMSANGEIERVHVIRKGPK